jgi:hypothetical protein
MMSIDRIVHATLSRIFELLTIWSIIANVTLDTNSFDPPC